MFIRVEVKEKRSKMTVESAEFDAAAKRVEPPTSR